MNKLFYVEGEEITLNKIIEGYKLNRNQIGEIKQLGMGYSVYLGIDFPMVHRIR